MLSVDGVSEKEERRDRREGETVPLVMKITFPLREGMSCPG
jgi:hypothetical protein